MFSSTFYPTPPDLARKMLRPYDFSDAYVLDPSAGKGDLLDAVAKKHTNHYQPPQLYAIEIVPELRDVLAGKGYPVLAADFLSYIPRIHFTHIVMNPPFDRGLEHLLYAWSMLYDGELVCVLPAAHLQQRTDKEKTLANLIADHGSSEPAGLAFGAGSGAERKTYGTEIVIVRLKKCASGERLEWQVKNDREERAYSDKGESQEVALQGFMADLLAHYNAALNHFDTYNQARQRLTVYCAPFAGAKSAIEISDGEKYPVGRHNVFIRTLTEQAWGKLLDHPGFQSILTERARKMMDEFRQRQKRVDFNEANIMAMFDELVAKKDDLLMGAVLDAFDTMTEMHEENRIYIEGWKNNKAWRVNLRKVVLPYYVEFSFGSFSMRYQRVEKLNDIDRALCVVANLPYDDILTVRAALEAVFHTTNRRTPGTTESTFFHIRFFKKGTIHLRFLDPALGQRFNLLAAKGRNWLPPGETA